MNIKKYNLIFLLSIISLITFIVHQLLFDFFKINDDSFIYSLKKLYLFFYGLSVLVFVILVEVKNKSFDNVGMSFLLVTNLKLVICYVVLKPILEVDTSQINIEKINFFGMFILFLAIETILTIRILNEKQ